MHLSFNMVTAGGGRSGVFSYVIKMAIDFPKTYPDHRFTFFITPDLEDVCNQSLPNVEIVVCDFPSRSAMKRMLWEQCFLPFELKARKIDLIYTFSVTDIFFAPCPTVIRVGNMLPYSSEAMGFQSGLKTKLRLHYLRLMLRLSAFTSNATLVMSEPAAKILVEDNGYPDNKVIGINRGVTLDSIKMDDTPIKNLPERYLLVISHIQEHKRLEEIIKGYSLIRNEIPLLIVGDCSDPAFFKKLQLLVENLGLTERVIFWGKIERPSLYSVIEPAEVIIFPSMVETYPSTLLEPMLAGSAMIVSNRGVMPAFCGDSVLYYDPLSPDDLSEKLNEYLESDSLRDNMKIKSKKRMSHIDTSWATAISKRYDLFDKIVNK